jgi:hypothetical protein
VRKFDWSLADLFLRRYMNQTKLIAKARMLQSKAHNFPEATGYLKKVFDFNKNRNLTKLLALRDEFELQNAMKF